MKQSVAEYYARDPKIFFDPQSPGSESACEIFELMVNRKWGELKMKQVVREAIKAVKFDGAGAFKTYFQFEKDFTRDEWNDRIRNDDVRTDWVPLCHLLKDPSANSWFTSPWIAHEIEARKDDIAAKFGLKGLDRNLITVTRSAHESTSELTQDVKSDFQFGTYFEVEDRKAGQIFYIVEGIDRKLKVKNKSYKYDSMYDFLFYNDIPGRADPLSDYSFWENQLKEVARFRTMQVNHAKKGIAKYKSLGQPLNEDQINQIRTPEDSVVINLEAGQDIQPFQHAQIDSGVFAAEQAVRQDIQIISKQAPRQSQQSKTATEVKAVEMAAQQVSTENRERLEEVMASIANKWAVLMQDNYTSTRVISLTEMSEAEFLGYRDSLNDESKERLLGDMKRPFLKITNEDISGTEEEPIEVKAGVKAGSTLPDNDEVRMNKFMSFVKFVSSIQPLAAQIDMEELLKEGVEIFGVRNDNLLVRKDNPVMESKILSAGVFVPAKMSEDHDKHLDIHQREFKGTDQEILHISMHKQFNSQIGKNKAAEMRSVINKMQQGPMGGLSFMGAMTGSQDGQLTPSNSPMPGMVQGMGTNGAMSPIGVQ